MYIYAHLSDHINIIKSSCKRYPSEPKLGISVQSMIQDKQTVYEIEDESPSDAVLAAVGEAKDENLEDLPPLYHSIDLEVVNTAVLDGENVCIGFDYQEMSITVDKERVVVEDYD